MLRAAATVSIEGEVSGAGRATRWVATAVAAAAVIGDVIVDQVLGSVRAVQWAADIAIVGNAQTRGERPLRFAYAHGVRVWATFT